MAIAARPDDIQSALAAYEQALFPRSAAAAAQAATIFDVQFGAGTPRSMVRFFTDHE